MFQAFGRWMIGRAVEREAPLPKWLRRWTERDEALARFEAASRRLGPMLRRDAAGWLDLQAEGVRVERRMSASARGAKQRPMRRARRRVAGVWAAGGLAAAMLLVALAWRAPRGDQPTVGPAHGSGQVATISPSEREQLLLAWRAGRANLGAWQARVKGASRRIGTLEVRYAALKFPRAGMADAATDRVLTALDAAAATQRRELADGMKSAYVFFARRLPASVATLVGLQEG